MDERTAKIMIDLESTLGHLQHDFEKQNEMILLNSRRLDRIEQTLRSMTAKIETLETPAQTRTQEDDRPPHY